MTTAQGSDLLHDVPYHYEPQLHIHHTSPANTANNNTTHTVSLDNDTLNPPFSPANTNKPSSSTMQDEFIPAVRTGDLFPSNPVSGQNVVNLLKLHIITTNSTAPHHSFNTNPAHATNTTNTTIATGTSVNNNTVHQPKPPANKPSVPRHTNHTHARAGEYTYCYVYLCICWYNLYCACLLTQLEMQCSTCL